MKSILKKVERIIVMGLLLTMSQVVSASSIEYTLTDNGSNNFTYNYTVDNTAGPDIHGFGIDFDTALFNETTLALTTPAGWNGTVLGSIPSVAPASADWENLTTLLSGSNATGFAVTFDWLGGVAGPGSQNFYTYDSSYADIDFGVTT